jgi:hypothetical protein
VQVNVINRLVFEMPIETTPFNQFRIYECEINIRSKIKWMFINAILASLNYGAGFGALIKGTSAGMGTILAYGNIGIAILLTIMYCHAVKVLYENLVLKKDILNRIERGAS